MATFAAIVPTEWAKVINRGRQPVDCYIHSHTEPTEWVKDTGPCSMNVETPTLWVEVWRICDTPRVSPGVDILSPLRGPIVSSLFTIVLLASLVSHRLNRCDLQYKIVIC